MHTSPKHADAIREIMRQMDVKGPNDGRPVIFIGVRGPTYIGHAVNTQQVDTLLRTLRLKAERISSATLNTDTDARFFVAHA